MIENQKSSENTVAELHLSVIIPFFNEEKNIDALYEEIKIVLEMIARPYELVFVNDGSRDATSLKLKSLADTDSNVVVIDLLRNFGQTAAMMAGFDHAKGSIVIAMDGDGQNDPAEIPNLLAELEKGFDVVSGWRKNRQDDNLTRKLPSKIANKLISKISGVHLHDYGCSLKVYRRDIIDGIRLYGEMHRFIPIYAAWQGGRISEIPVHHRPRAHGESKYGLERIFKVILDLLLVLFMERFMTKPIYVFGGFGLLLLFVSLFTALSAVLLRIFADISFISTPLPVLTGTFFSTGVICVLLGLLAELVVRTYYEAQGKNVYQVRKSFNHDNK
jgi:glycosyltransferase involved in cell wall biosynthesis